MYMLTVSVQGVENPVDVIVPAATYYGGVYYSVLVFGGGPDAVPFDARVAGTEINVSADSLGVQQPEVVAAVPTATPTLEAVPPVTTATTEVVQPPVVTEIAPLPTAEALSPLRRHPLKLRWLCP